MDAEAFVKEEIPTSAVPALSAQVLYNGVEGRGG